MKGMHFKSEIAQWELSDLWRILQHIDIHSPSVAAGEDALKVIRSAERVGAHSTMVKYFTKSFYLSFIQSGTSYLLGIVIPVYLL
jgi:hypothetical protein